MGMFTRLNHEGKIYQFKTGWDDLLTVQQGDTIPWEPNEHYPGEHIDGAHIAFAEEGSERRWVVIKDRQIFNVTPVQEGDTELSVAELYDIQPPPRELWSELAWARKALRDARSEVDRLLWAQRHPDDDTGAGLYIHLHLRDPSFMERMFPLWDEAKLSDEQRLIADMLRVGDSMAPALGLEERAERWQELASQARQLLQSVREEQQELTEQSDDRQLLFAEKAISRRERVIRALVEFILDTEAEDFADNFGTPAPWADPDEWKQKREAYDTTEAGDESDKLWAWLARNTTDHVFCAAYQLKFGSDNPEDA